MKRYALLIGINDYNLLGELKYARQDAEAVAEALCKYYGFTDQDITLMSCQGEGATLGLSRYIEHALMSLTDLRDLDLLVFGFWGHGFSPSPGERYLCGSDTMEHDLKRTAVSFDVVKSKLAQTQAENTLLVLDCCQDRPAGRSASAEPMTAGEEAALTSFARDIQAAQRGRRLNSIPTVAILNACCEGQKAYEWGSSGHGIFTAHLLDAFAKGFSSIGPLSSWTVDRVSRTASTLHRQEQVPFITIKGKGDIVLPLSGSVADLERPTRQSGLHSKPIVFPPPIPVTSVEWWVAIDGQDLGPLNESTIRKMIVDGTITGDSLCWKKGMDQWRSIAGTRELDASFVSKPADRIESEDAKKNEQLRLLSLLRKLIAQSASKNAKQDEIRLRQSIADDIKQCQALLLKGKGSKNHIEKVHQTRFAKWQRAAELGWPEAQWLIGRYHDEGLSVSKDQAQAVKWHRKAAEQGYAVAQYNLGVCYDNGKGISKDNAEAVKWFRKAANKGHASAQYNLGVCYNRGKSLISWERDEDQAQAVKWYRKAAEQGYASAQNKLGVHYDSGIGVSGDQAEAVKWFRKAAGQGHVTAQYNLGMCYDNGRGVSKDQVEAVKWYRKAAKQGHASAQNNLGACYSNGAGISKDQAEAVKWYQKAADQGNASAQCNLAMCYSYGDGVSRDETESEYWSSKSARQGQLCFLPWETGACYKKDDILLWGKEKTLK